MRRICLSIKPPPSAKAEDLAKAAKKPAAVRFEIDISVLLSARFTHYSNSLSMVNYLETVYKLYIKSKKMDKKKY